GSAYTDGNACTRSDTCQRGVCAGGNSVVCAAPDQCHDAATCNPATGASSNPLMPHGSACTDGNACTRSDTGQSGVCAGGTPVVCAAPVQFHAAGPCNRATVAPTRRSSDLGSACTDDNVCTRSDTCQRGVCAGGNSVVCPAPDQCHD